MIPNRTFYTIQMNISGVHKIFKLVGGGFENKSFKDLVFEKNINTQNRYIK